ncbi:hypothetical protein [Streptomyces sp. NL15-2K]|uniref:hypothetical protein n=1 Tax=Streptomyces sp. NL15-2K TaxID=376149 RepID=UPI000F5694AD|nr:MULTISPECIES: hypothetical protein [Actinomycetes]WKX08043.1 hypothetical protein Q4V64_11385 [Kutzneria buriramensis]GCB50498.1 hypothetical protein SNL152K_7842 [Streptomyces sp. NL15-2K]
MTALCACAPLAAHREGHAFEPARAVRHSGVLLIAQPCTEAAAALPRTAQLIAVDDLDRVTPHRRPFGNEVAKARLEHPNTEKVVARPR